MKRRKFIRLTGGLSMAYVLSAGCVVREASHNSRHLVATSSKRAAYLKDMLDRLCTELVTRPAGSEAYHKGCDLFKSEMEKALPDVHFDRFPMAFWELSGKAVFRVKGNNLDITPFFQTPATPAQGLTGRLEVHENGNDFWIENPSGGKLAYLWVSPFGRAVPRSHTEKEAFGHGIGIGKQHMPLLKSALAEKAEVFFKFDTESFPNTNSHSVVGTLPGETEDEILLLAHLDTQYTTPGANDNTASAIAMLMLAHAFSGTRPKKTITFMATAAEECGYLGVKSYHRRRKAEGTLGNIEFCLNFDSLTYGMDLQIYSTDSELRALLKKSHQAVQAKGTPRYFEEDDSLDGKIFIEAGARGLYANSRGDENERTLPLWHRPEDTADTVRPEYVENSFLVFQEFLRRLSES